MNTYKLENISKPRAIAMKPIAPATNSSSGSMIFPLRTFNATIMQNMPLFTINADGRAMPVFGNHLSPFVVPSKGLNNKIGMLSSSHVITPPSSPALLPKSTKPVKSETKPERPGKVVEKKITRRRLKLKDPKLFETITIMCSERIVGRSVMSKDEMEKAVVDLQHMLNRMDKYPRNNKIKSLRCTVLRAYLKLSAKLKSERLDVDDWIVQHFKNDRITPIPIANIPKSIFERNGKYSNVEVDFDQNSIDLTAPIASEKLFKTRLGLGDGSFVKSNLKTKSPFSGRQLPDFIWRDFETKSPWMQTLESIDKCSEHPETIDYCYLNTSNLQQANTLLCRLFWPGIDLSSDLTTPEHAIIVMYGKRVVGCGILDLGPSNSYITYLAVDYGWRNCGIASTLLYFLTSMYNKDVLLHVQPTNWNAMKVYQKWGFKAEKYLVGFYSRYVPWKTGEGPDNWNTRGSRNALYMRLRK